MAALTALAIAGLVVGLAGTAKSVVDQRKAAKESAKQADLSARQADMQHAQQVKDQLRRSRIASASVINAAATSGTQGSSGEIGGLASVSSQAAGNIGSIQTQYGLASGIGAASAEAGKHQGDAAVAGAVAGIGNQVFDATGGYKNLMSGVV